MSRQKREKDPQCDAMGAQFGNTLNRLRQAGKLSLGELSEQSGVAKSMISQIEKNESNPTLATITRLSRALGTSVEAILAEQPNGSNGSALVQKSNRQDIPLIQSEDGLCTLRIIGWIETVEYTQWYDFEAQPGGKLESSPHPIGSIENLSVLQGEVEVRVGGESWTAKAGETLRYKADREHVITNIGDTDVRATMVNILAHAVT